MEPATLRGGWGKGGVSMLWGAHSQWRDQWGRGENFKGSGDWRGMWSASPQPVQVPEWLLGSWAWTSALQGPLWSCGSWTKALFPTPTLPRPFLAFFCVCVVLFALLLLFQYYFYFSKVFFIFLILFYFLFFVIVLLLFICCLFFFFFFLPNLATCGVLVPRSRVGPELLWWEHWVKTAGLTENLRPQGILISVSSPGCPHFGTKLPLPNCLQIPVLDSSGQTTSKKGT